MIPRTSYTISLAASGSQDIILGERAIESRDVVSAVLIGLVHSKTFASSTAAFTIKAHNTFFDPNDPTILWANTAASALASLAVANGDTAPQPYFAALSSPIGAYLRCSLSFSQGANTGSNTFDVSVYLVLRDA